MSTKETKPNPDGADPGQRPFVDQSRGPLTSLQQITEALEEEGCHPKVSRGGNGSARCPAHGDRHASLSFAAGDSVPVVVKCHAGCSFEKILGALGFSPGPEIVECEYLDADGELSYVIRRGGHPPFCVSHWDGRKLVSGLGDREKILYRLPEVIEAVKAGEVVYVAEGEKDADSVSAQGVCATTNPFGAGKWDDSFSAVLAGAEVRVIIDDDPAGYRHGAVVVASLDGVAKSVAVFKAAEGNDATNHLDAGFTLDELVPVPLEDLAAAPPIELPEGYRLGSSGDDERARPELHPDARHGLIGEAVAVFGVESEVDPVAVIVQLLAVIGAFLGRRAWVQVGSDIHYGNLFVCLVGRTSAGRKGMALGCAMQLLRLVDPEFVAKRFTGGLGSGEGLISFVSDMETVAGKEVERNEDDKRAVVKAAEMSSLLKVAGREGQILSEVVREAFDGGDLRNVTKHSPVTATGAVISMIGHVTPDELQRRLDETEKANGFANRFMWVFSERRQQVAIPRAIEDDELKPIALALCNALEEARSEN